MKRIFKRYRHGSKRGGQHYTIRSNSVAHPKKLYTEEEIRLGLLPPLKSRIKDLEKAEHRVRVDGKELLDSFYDAIDKGEEQIKKNKEIVDEYKREQEKTDKENKRIREDNKRANTITDRDVIANELNELFFG
jgi:hypothetical protein